jgi:hypothetical protein
VTVAGSAKANACLFCGRQHENVVVLDLESELMQLGMTRVRDFENEGAARECGLPYCYYRAAALTGRGASCAWRERQARASSTTPTTCSARRWTWH